MRQRMTLGGLVVTLAIALAASAGCGGGSVGREGDVAGGPCTADSECAAGSMCLIETDFPGGTCTLMCTSQADCPGGTSCVQENGGTCLLSCGSASDCRDGYRCVEKSNLGSAGSSMICIL